MPPPPPPDDHRAGCSGEEPGGEEESILLRGTIEIQGRMPWSSNGTYLVTVTDRDEEIAAIYKPGRAERPLWDFPDGLYRREVAAFELARQLRWDMVPETVLRHDGPLDEGSLQRFVDADFEQHYFTLLEDEHHHPALRRMATFDLVANNADRKGGHCLLDRDAEIWGIDHGLCFHTESKIRTVIWDFAGETIDDNLVRDLERFEHQGPSSELQTLLHDDEVEAMVRRVRRLLARPRFPEPRSGRPYPWPLV
ncbi:MAG: SCO1664 family protein [Acidimicrobiaceae bacterium]|nr:SCO1664 family protein [Acidimicrobiaceae bacterium]